MAGGLDGPRLMDVDVPGLGAQGPLVGPQQGGDHRLVGLGAPHQEGHLRLGSLAGLQNQLPGVAAVLVHPVTRGLLQVGLGQPLQNAGMGSLAVVALKSNHGFSLLRYFHYFIRNIFCFLL